MAAQLFPARSLPLDGGVCHTPVLQPARRGLRSPADGSRAHQRPFARRAQFGERLFYWHGNLLFFTAIGHDSIPGNWGIAKRRYLERCVDLYGDSLATAGIHVNLSLPDPLFAWDFMHLPAMERGNRHLDQYKSEFYITATRLLRAFASLFIATSASTPLQAQVDDGPRSRLAYREQLRPQPDLPQPRRDRPARSLSLL